MSHKKCDPRTHLTHEDDTSSEDEVSLAVPFSLEINDKGGQHSSVTGGHPDSTSSRGSSGVRSPLRNFATSPTQRFSRLDEFLAAQRSIVMLGAPINTGISSYGPTTIVHTMRQEGLEDVIRSSGWHLEDLGDLDLSLNYSKDKDHPKIHNSYAIGKALEKVYDCAYQASRRGAFILTVGGDRSLSSATVSGVLKSRRDMCVLFVGAYGDCNTPKTTNTGEYRGMAAAHVLGWFQEDIKGFEWMKNFVPEHRCAFIGLRDVDVQEARKMRESGVRIFSMYEIDRYGIGAVMDMALHSINPHNDRSIHLSFALNALDGDIIPTLGEGGLTFREAHFICETLSATNVLGSMDIVHMCSSEPTGDTIDFTKMCEKSTRLALSLISSAIGKRIL